MTSECDAEDAVARLIYRYCKLYLAGQNLANADRASMAASLELRAPFLDHTFVELTARIPSAQKLRGVTKLKDLMKPIGFRQRFSRAGSRASVCRSVPGSGDRCKVRYVSC